MTCLGLFGCIFLNLIATFQDCCQLLSDLFGYKDVRYRNFVEICLIVDCVLFFFVLFELACHDHVLYANSVAAPRIVAKLFYDL